MINQNALDRILTETVDYIGKSKIDIFDIAESTRQEYTHVETELAEVRKEVAALIERIDRLNIKKKLARQRLVHVSKNFDLYNETDIKRAYDAAQKIQLQVVELQGHERLLRYKRDNLERNLKRLEDVLKKAENMMTHLGVVLEYMQKHMDNLSEHMDELIQVKKMGVHIIKAQEEERRRIAREIHDGPAQLLANITMQSEYVVKLMDINPPQVKIELEALRQLVRQSLQEVRKIIFDLRPMVLDDLGLVSALQRYTHEYELQHQIHCNFSFFGDEKRLPTTAEVALFRVVQEALGNVQKHAQARQVSIKMEQLNDKVTIIVKDDGQGFDPQKPYHNSNDQCYGLINMRERMQILDGSCKINSTPGKGTVITFTAPV